MIVTTGKSVMLADGQMQTQVFLDDGSGKVIEDHLSHAGTAASLAARIRTVYVKPAPPTLIAAGSVIDLTPAVVVPPTPPADAADRQAFNDAMIADLRALTLSQCSQKTRDLFRPEWIADVVVSF